MENSAQCGFGAEKGVSLLEILIVIVIILVVSAVAIQNISGSLQASQADSAAQLVQQDMRLARQSAISDRLVYRLTFNSPGGIVMDKIATISTVSGSTITVNTTVTNVGNDSIPSTVTFNCEPGIPLDPDGFGSVTVPISFNGYNQVFFQPDGSGRDTTGKVANGVIFLAVPGDIATSRSITLWGGTGQVHLYKLYSGAGGWFWK
jgi:prepilin-type N-terminal cleavage/methylation domain-containing protein